VGSQSPPAWVVGCNRVPGGFGIYSWNGTGWVQQPGGAVRITVSPDVIGQGAAWVTNDVGQIFTWMGTGWMLVPGCAHDIASADIDVFVVGCNPVPGGYGIYHGDTNGWAPMPGGAVSIAVDTAENVWVTNDVGQIYLNRLSLSSFTYSGWALLPGCGHDIGVGEGFSGLAWVVGCNRVPGGFGIYSWNGTGWVPQPGGADSIAVHSSVNSDHPWVTNDVGQIWSS
jgi:hypothetical protein